MQIQNTKLGISLDITLTGEKAGFTRNQLIATLVKIGHGDLMLFREVGLAAARWEPGLLGHFITWYNTVNKGKVRDLKVALPVTALRWLTKDDQDLAENAVANLMLLSPRDLVRAWDFNKDLSSRAYVINGGWRGMLMDGMTRYLQEREDSIKWWDRTVLQHRDSMKRLYRITHKSPSGRAKAVLFDQEYPSRSVFAKVAGLRLMTAKEAASVILANHIPLEVAIGSVSKAKSPDIVLALLEGMTGNQVVTNTKMLERLGVMTDPALKGAYEAALARARGDKKMDALKLGRAAEAMATAGAAGEVISSKLLAVQDEKVRQLKGIDGDWLVAGDCSGSMTATLEVARQVASLITARVTGKVHLVFFNQSPTAFDVTGLGYEQIKQLTKNIRAGGGTSIGCALDYIGRKGEVVQGIAVCSDGGDNQFPLFHDAYAKYVKDMEVEPTVYLFHVDGDSNHMDAYCKRAGITVETLELGSKVDYYSLPALVDTLRVNKYSLVDEVSEVPLLTLEEVFKVKERAQAAGRVRGSWEELDGAGREDD